MIRPFLTATLLAFALPASAQAVPAANYTDMWWNPSESGWGISFMQHATSNQVFAVWYTYDPREVSSSGRNKPLWFVMPGGTWTSPTRLTGTAYVTNGEPFNQSGSSGQRNTPVGTLTFDCANASSGTFTYSVTPPTGLASNDPAFNLPPLSGSKSIQRQSF
jgi:hypothetical protein